MAQEIEVDAGEIGLPKYSTRKSWNGNTREKECSGTKNKKKLWD